MGVTAWMTLSNLRLGLGICVTQTFNCGYPDANAAIYRRRWRHMRHNGESLTTQVVPRTSLNASQCAVVVVVVTTVVFGRPAVRLPLIRGGRDRAYHVCADVRALRVAVSCNFEDLFLPARIAAACGAQP